MGIWRNRLSFLLYFTLLGIYSSGQSSSILSSGQWAKLAVTANGIYKIDYRTLQTSGFDPASVNPQFIQLYGRGGGMLPQSNQESRPIDLSQISLSEYGLDDQSFDRDDYLLFYAEGPGIQVIEESGHLLYQKNLYSDTAYYFLTVGSHSGSRVNSMVSLGDTHQQISSYQAYFYHELERENMLSSGRHWFGELLSATNRVRIRYENAPELLPGTSMEIIANVVNTSQQNATFTFSVNTAPAGTIAVTGVGSDTYDDKGIVVQDTLISNGIQVNDRGNLDYEIGFQGPGNGMLDYFTATYEAPLTFSSEPLYFTSPKSLSSQISSYTIENLPANASIWDITNPENVLQQEFQHAGQQATFGADSKVLRRYVAFTGSDFPTPQGIQPVKNQNLKALETPELLIVTHSLFLPQAERLAAFRSVNDGLRVTVITTDEIYNEFSSGRQDVTAIRDLVRYYYQQSDDLKYLLLFGRCSYDYRDLTNDNTNHVPTYQSRNSTDPIYSYNSDDYFGFLDEDEGYWSEQLSGSGGHLLDIGVGRLPVTSPEEAKIVVDKLIHYAESQESSGNWRKQVYFVADDGDFNLHQRDADRLATNVDTTYENFDVKKIYMDAYPQEETPNGESAEAVNQELEETIKKGALIINYTGHGSEFRWAQESILTHNMINAWENLDRLPLFVTATCEFGRYDDPERISGAEKLILNPNGGAIGLVTTARPVFASKNYILNRALYEVALEKKESGYPTLGDIFKYIKNDSYQIVANRNFALLGDPSMKLSYPRESMQITGFSVDGVEGDTIKALSRVNLLGEVLSDNGTLLSDYQGIAEVTVYDQPQTVETLGSDGGRTFTFEHRNKVLFRGQATVQAGKFEVSFVAPEEMETEVRAGKISLYALSTNGLADASGTYDSFLIGDVNKNSPADNTPPAITLYMDDLSFTDGGTTDKNPVFLARITDESGINIANSSEQGLTALLDGEKEFILNDFYTADQDSYQSGWIRYPFNRLNDGLHTVTLTVWDTYGNPSESTLSFYVNEGNGLTINELHNFPNPFNESTSFFIDHNRPGDDLEVNIRIFDRQGRLVHQILTNYENSPSTIRDLKWNGTNDGGAPLESGLYLYQVIVKSASSGNKNVSNQKMVLIK